MTDEENRVTWCVKKVTHNIVLVVEIFLLFTVTVRVEEKLKKIGIVRITEKKKENWHRQTDEAMIFFSILLTDYKRWFAKFEHIESITRFLELLQSFIGVLDDIWLYFDPMINAVRPYTKKEH
jgi:hypothetical protein